MPLYGLAGTWYGLHKLRFLNLSDCGTAIVPEFVFSDMPSLVAVNLSGNLLGHSLGNQSYARMFDNQTKLETLDLSRNTIHGLPSGMFSTNQKLTFLSLKNNSLSDIPFRIKQLVALEYIDVSGNRISGLSSRNMEDLKAVAELHNITINLAGNPLRCACADLDFITWMAQTKVEFTDLPLLRCISEHNTVIRMDDLQSLSYRLKYECTALYVVLGCVMVFMGLLLVLTFFAMLYYNQWRLRYLYDIGRPAVNPYHPLEKTNITLDYDAYFSFDEDYRFSTGQLLRTYMYGTVVPVLRISRGPCRV